METRSSELQALFWYQSVDGRSENRTSILIDWSFRFCFRLRQSCFRWIISDGVISGIGRKWKRSGSSDSESVELMTPLTTPIFVYVTPEITLCYVPYFDGKSFVQLDGSLFVQPCFWRTKITYKLKKIGKETFIFILFVNFAQNWMKKMSHTKSGTAHATFPFYFPRVRFLGSSRMRTEKMRMLRMMRIWHNKETNILKAALKLTVLDWRRVKDE